jgi:teichuronic acid biosynthesis glycosyltransferase TuaC
VRALVLSNMLPGATTPERGRFVRDQVEALRELGGWDVELYEFAPGARALLGAARQLRAHYGNERFDVVHAHFGLTAWPALAVRARGRALTVHGTDVRHPRTRLATRAALPTIGLLAAVSEALVEELPGRGARERARVLPCGVDTGRFKPMPRASAREQLKLEPDAPYVLFAADPARAEKRYDRAQALAEASGARLLALGGVDPSRVPLYVNAVNAVLVPSEREGFGLAVLEALACDVPVLATPVGIHRQALAGLEGALCAPFELERWRAALEPHLLAGPARSSDAAGRPPNGGQYAAADAPRVEGRSRAEGFSAKRMAERVTVAWRSLVADGG